MNQKLATLLERLDTLREELKNSNAEFKKTNDRFAAYVARWAPHGGGPVEWRRTGTELPPRYLGGQRA